MNAVFPFITHEKGFKFWVQPQTVAYSCYMMKALVSSFLKTNETKSAKQ